MHGYLVLTPLISFSCLSKLFCIVALLGSHTVTLRAEEANNTQLLGHHDLQGRSAYQPIIQKQGGRWIAYIGHHNGSGFNTLTDRRETNGTSIVDVTNPGKPVLLHHLAATAGAQMVQTCEGKVLPIGDDKIYMLRSNGDTSHQVWDVTRASMPKLISTPVSGGRHTHKNWWDCKTGIAYLVYDGKQIGWRSNRLVWIVDLSDPYHPQTIRQFGLLGHEPASNQNTVPPGAHEATLSPNGDRLFVAYGTGSDGVMQIVDIKKLLACRPRCPQQPTSEEMRYPQIGRLDMPGYWGGHTAWPLMGMELPEHAKFRNGSPRNFVVLVSEAFSHKCRGDSHDMVFIVDISDESVPFSVANYQVKESSGNYCQRGGRFGAHSVAWSYNTPYYKKLIALSYFNAGLRLVDVRDPFHPKEVGFYIPSKNSNSSLSAIQTNNVEIDDRGYIYLVDRSHSGLHIVELSATLRKSLQ